MGEQIRAHTSGGSEEGRSPGSRKEVVVLTVGEVAVLTVLARVTTGLVVLAVGDVNRSGARSLIEGAQAPGSVAGGGSTRG